jgi:hypothetical protein
MIQWDKKLWLLNEQEFDQLDNNVTLACINGKTYIKSSIMDRDTRFEHLAYGLTEELVEQQGLKHQWLVWLIKK